MTCEVVRDSMCEYLDGLLNGKEREAFESHLEICSTCRQEAEELKLTLGWLKQAGDVTPPAGLRAAVLTQLRRERSQSRRHSAGFTQAAAAAAVFVMLVAGNLYTIQPVAMQDAVRPGNEQMEAYHSPAESDDTGVSVMEEKTGAPVLTENSDGAGESEVDSMTNARSESENVPAVNTLTEQRSRLSLRLVLNLVLLPLFLLLSALALKKRKEATP